MSEQNRPYNRTEINKVFAKVKFQMHTEALERGKTKGIDKAVYQDVYTGKELFGGDTYDYEHLRSSEELFNKYKHMLNDAQIALVVNCPENVAVTHKYINQSKGKKRLEDWLGNPTNVSLNAIDVNLAMVNLKKADDGIERMVKELMK